MMDPKTQCWAIATAHGPHDMAEISVSVTTDGDGWVADVTVSEGSSNTRHRVTVTNAVYQKLAGDAMPPETLVRASFAFLLEREPKESILREFDLPVIGRYFPEYEAELTRRLGS